MKNKIPIIATLALTLLVGGILLYLSHKNPISEATASERGLSPLLGEPTGPIYTAEMAAKQAYEASFEVWLDKLEAYENCPSQGIIDSNNLRSYGPLCFQKATYLAYMRLFGSQVMPYAEEGEWLNNLSDRHTQRHLARLIIEDDHSAWRNWWTSIKVRKMGEPPKLYY